MNVENSNNDNNSSKTVTSVISRSIKPGYEKNYDDWVLRYLALERNALGYLGTTIILPGVKTEVTSPRWKMAIVVFITAYAISLISRYILNPSIRDWPLPANGIIFTAILVIGLTYFAMPVSSRLLRGWLYPLNNQS